MKKVFLAGLTVSLLSVFSVELMAMEDQIQKMEEVKDEWISAEKLSSDKVEMIQEKLNEKGFSVGKVDGIFGKNTKSALTSFQRSQNMGATGELNQETLDALGISFETPKMQSEEEPVAVPQPELDEDYQEEEYYP